MAIFNYKAKEGAHKVAEGKIEASSKDVAIKKLEGLGLFPIKIEEAPSSKNLKADSFLFKRAKPKKVTIATRQISTLIKSGVPILRAIEIVSSQIDDKFLRVVLGDIHNDIKEGKPFSSSLLKYPLIFSKFYISMVKVGEDSGSLDKVLARVATHREQQHDIFSKIKVALVYPAAMLLVGIGTIIFMLTFVMPRLMNIFETIDTKLPLITEILINMSEFLQTRWPVMVIGLICVVFIYKRQSKTKAFNSIMSNLKLRIPFIKNFVLQKEMARFSRTLEVLIRSGIPILKALDLTIPILDNEVVKLELYRTFKEVEDGASLGASLKKSKLFPSFVISLISIGEESGRMEGALGELASAYEKELSDSMKVFTTMLEPIMILVMGLLVGFVVMAMLLPIFQINIMIN